MSKPKGKGKAKGKKPARPPVLLEHQPEAAPAPEEPAGPRLFTADDLEWLLDWISEGGSLRGWAEKAGRSHPAVVRWIRTDKARQEAYREARRMQADAHIDQLIELADEPVPMDDDGKLDSAAVNDKRLRIDTRKWIASKYHPAMYADRVDVGTPADTDPKRTTPDAIMQKIVGLLAQHGLTLAPKAEDA